MTRYRRHALFELIVAALAAAAVAAILAATGQVLTSLTGFALLGLLGLRALATKDGRTSPLQDERDEAIHKRAAVAGHVALWLALVAWGVVVPLRFAAGGSVPLAWVAPVVWVAWWLVVCVRSIAVLVLDSRGA